jgi:type I restriction enzyme S subunit
VSGLPDGWECTAVGDVCREVPKVAASTLDLAFSYVDVSSVDGTTHSVDEVRVLEPGDAPSRARQPLEVGDTVFATVRPYLEKIAFVDQSLDGAIGSTAFCVLRPGSRVLPRYLYYFAMSPAMLDQVLPQQRGVSYPAVLDRDVRSARIPLPSIDEQRRIVEILEDHLCRLDAAEGSLESAQRRIAAFAISSRRATFDAVVDEGAPIVNLTDVASIANGHTPKGLADRAAGEPGEASVPFYKVGDMNLTQHRWMARARAYLDPDDVADLKLTVRPAGTVLLPKRGGAIATNKKRILAAPACYDLNTMGLIPGPNLRSEYLWHWLQGEDLSRIADGSNVPQINAPQIRGLRIPLADLADQQMLCDRLDSLASDVGQPPIDHATKRSRSMRRTLLAAAFSGRLTSDFVPEVA